MSAWCQEEVGGSGRVTHTPGSACKHLPLLQQHFPGVSVVVDHDDTVGAHHQGVGLSIFALQRFEKHMGRVGAPQTEHAANQGQRRQSGGLLQSRLLGHQLHHQQNETDQQEDAQRQEPVHIATQPRSLRSSGEGGGPRSTSGPSFYRTSSTSRP